MQSLLPVSHRQEAESVPHGLSRVQQQPEPPLWNLRKLHLQQPVVRPELRSLRKQLRREGAEMLRRSLRRPQQRRRQLRGLRTRLPRGVGMHQWNLQRDPVPQRSDEVRQHLRLSLGRQQQLRSLRKRLRDGNFLHQRDMHRQRQYLPGRLDLVRPGMRRPDV